MNVAAEPTPNPAILVWARQESGLSVERIAKRLAVSVDKIPLSLFTQEAPPQLTLPGPALPIFQKPTERLNSHSLGSHLETMLS